MIAPTIAVANDYCAYLVRQGHRVGIATSEDTPAARLAIKNFRGGRGVVPGHEIDCLVTVGMAYEGLDVPQITHIACLPISVAVPGLNRRFVAPTVPMPRMAKPTALFSILMIRVCATSSIPLRQSSRQLSRSWKYVLQTSRQGQVEELAARGWVSSRLIQH